jgi:hypothetical protein
MFTLVLLALATLVRFCAGEFRIGGPGPGRPSGGYTNSEHVPHLLAYVGAVEEERTSSNGKDKYTVANCKFVICLTDKKAWADTDVSGKVLAPRILTSDSEIVVVRLNTGEAKGDHSAPILPEDPIAVELEEVQETFTKYGARLPSGTVIFDVVAYNADNKPPAETPLG